MERELQRLDKKVEALKDRIAQHENALAKYEKKGKQSKRKQDVLEKVTAITCKAYFLSCPQGPDQVQPYM